MRRIHFYGVSAIVLGAVTLAGCGRFADAPAAAPVQAGSPIPPVSPSISYETVRPATQLEQDLGLILSVEENDELTRMVLCLAPGAKLDPVDTVPPNGQLRMTDAVAFHDKFGYGVIANYLDAIDVQRARADVELTEARSETPSCSANHDDIIGEYFPPAEATVRAYSLVRGVEARLAELSEYTNWVSCMGKAGYDVSIVGLDVRLLVQAALDDALGMVNHHDDEYSEVLQELPEATISTLLTGELQLWSADSRCLGESGLGQLLSADLEQAKTQLAAEFPSLDLLGRD